MTGQALSVSNLSPPGGALAPIAFETTLLRQKIVAALRRAIELGTLGAGDRLIEKDLCERLGVSRTSLREALRDLEANGVVTKVSARELIITRLSPSEAESLYAIRGAIEAIIAEKFIAHGTAADFDRLRAVLREMGSEEMGVDAALDLRREFYRVWCEVADDAIAFEFLSNLQLRLSVLSSNKARNPSLIAQDIAEKARVVDCMARADLDGTRAALREHAQNAAQAAFAGSGPKP